MKRKSAVLASVAVLTIVSLFSSFRASANNHTCNGKKPTVDGNKGTPRDDVIIAERYSRVHGYGGDDTICAWVSGEDDVFGAKVFAGKGNDWVEVEADENWNYFYVWGEAGHDELRAHAYTGVNIYLVGGPGNDMIVGQGGGADQGRVLDDTIAIFDTVGPITVDFKTGRVETDRGIDTIIHIEKVLGGDKSDVFRGTHRREFINGGRGNDMLNGRGGADALDGGPGDDTVHGRGGKDRVFGGTGRDEVNGGLGVDFLWFFGGGRDPFPFANSYTHTFPGDDLKAGIYVNLSRDRARFADNRYVLDGIENVRANSGDDQLIGNRLSNVLLGEAGNDRLSGRRGDDDLDGDQGSDRFDGGGGTDRCIGSGTNDTFERCEQQE